MGELSSRARRLFESPTERTRRITLEKLRLNERATAVYNVIVQQTEQGVSVTPEFVAQALGMEITQIRPRFTELRNKRLIESAGESHTKHGRPQVRWRARDLEK